MIRKLRQQLDKHRTTQNNRNPNIRSRQFLMNYLRQRRHYRSSASMRASAGITRWFEDRVDAKEQPRAPRIGCFITGRPRGLTQRFSIARTKIKELSAEAVLSGVRKSSW